MATPNKGSSAVIQISTNGTTFSGVGGILTFTASISIDDIDVTDFDSAGWKEVLAGDRQLSGSLDLNYEDGDAGQDTLLGVLTASAATITLRVRPAGTGTGKKEIEFLAKLSGGDIATPENDKVTLSFSFVSSGEVTISDQA